MKNTAAFSLSAKRRPAPAIKEKISRLNTQNSKIVKALMLIDSKEFAKRSPLGETYQ